MLNINKNNKGFINIIFILVLITTLFGLYFIVGGYLIKRNTDITKKSEFIKIVNTRYGFSITYPLKDFEVKNNLVDNSTTNAITFTRRDNKGILTLAVIENPGNKTFLELCNINSSIDDNDFNGSCDAKQLKTEDSTINNMSWQKISNDSVKYFPEGHVRYATNKNNFLYYIIDTSKDDIAIKPFVELIQIN